ncbi:hypothetical protein BH09BAC4_BH09BAC4_07320 [soil metagenome]
MKPLILALVSALTIVSAFGQKFTFWGNLKAGSYQVGYQDTLLLKTDELFSYKDYQGAKPFFISIWFPIPHKTKLPDMTYQDYYQYAYRNGLDSVRNALIRVDKSVFMTSGILANMDTWGKIEFTQNEQELWQAILNTKVNAHRTSQFPTQKYPTIIYNHGGGGTPNENAVLFEFLASHGFVIISCNYKYPADNEQGYAYYYASSNYNYLTDIDFVIQFGKNLSFTDTNRFYYAGHSFGAQQGLKLNQKGNRDIKQYILLDTTLEDYPLEAVKQLWPQLDTLIQRHAQDFKTKTVIITAPRAYYEGGKYLQQRYPAFTIYKFLSAETVTKLNSKQPMNHTSFLSLGIIKKFYAHKYSQIDNQTALGQVSAYFDVVRLVLSILTDKELNRDKFLIVN